MSSKSDLNKTFRSVSKIKGIRIPIPDYKFFHSPYSDSSIDTKFIGRNQQKKDFVNILQSTATKKGKYLISGARGVGKTSFVGKVIEELRLNNSDKYIHIPITFNEELQTEREVLIQIIKTLCDKIALSKRKNKRKTREESKGESINNGITWFDKLLKRIKSIPLIRIIPTGIILLSVLSIFMYEEISSFLLYIYNNTPDFIHSAFESVDKIPVLHLSIFLILILASILFLLRLYVRSTDRSKKQPILDEIYRVKNSLNAQKVKENGFSFKARIFSFRHRTKMSTDVLSVKDLERKIADWCEKLSSEESFKNPYQVIITFDELDKLNLLTSDDSLGDVVQLFSKLKNFLTETSAKFIFISGVEMHQRFLDTYSDRSNLLISIIDREEQINSFLFNEPIEELKDVSSTHIFQTIEYYVCKNIKEGCRSLKEIGNIIKCEKEKSQVIHALYHFINYMCFVSNGNPKKLMIHFEKQIHLSNSDMSDYITVEWNTGKSINPDNQSNNSKSDKERYFYLSYSDQVKNSFINYLVNPINNGLLKDRKNLNDGLLVASSYLLNHIFKYYKNSFSLRNKEHFPEIFLSNSSTEFRTLVGEMISFLSQNHIQPIMSSVFQYKLPIKITEEIKNITKLSDDASAIFNFSQTEFSSIKDYCNSNIKELYALNLDNKNKLQISSYYHILGDSYLFSNDLNDTITSYQASSELLKDLILDYKKSNEKIQLIYFTKFIRVQLKLGLAYEKRGTHDDALTLYDDLVSMIREFLDIDLSSLGLRHEKTEKFNDSANREYTLISHYNKKEVPDLRNYIQSSDYLKHQSFIDKLNFLETVRMITQPLLTSLFIREKILNSEIKLSDIDSTVNNFTNIFLYSEKKEQFIITADFYKRLGDILFFKNNLGNRLENNMTNILYFYDLNPEKRLKSYGVQNEEPNELVVCSESKELRVYADQKRLVEVNENSILKSYLSDYVNFENFKKLKIPKITEDVFLKRINDSVKACIKLRSLSKKRLSTHMISPSCLACKYYTRSLRYMLCNFIHISYEEIKSTSKTKLIFKYLDSAHFSQRGANFLQTMATTLSSLGDTLLACQIEENIITDDESFYDSLLILLKKKDKGYRVFKDYDCKSTTQKIILYYYLSSRFYAKAGKHSEHMFQLKKILMLFAELESKNTLDVSIEILKKINKCKLSIYNHSSILEDKKLASLFGNAEEGNKYGAIKYSSVYADIEDAVYFVKEAHVSNPKLDQNSHFKDFFNQDEQPLSTIYNRMLRLRLNALINKNIIGIDFSDEEWSEKLNNKLSYKVPLSVKIEVQTIIDSIFCLKRFTDYIKEQVGTKLFTNSIIAQVYYDLACWSELLCILMNNQLEEKAKEEENNKVLEALKYDAGIEDFGEANYKYYYGKAVHYYYNIIEMHNQGQAYERTIENMHSVNDDLNDDLFHYFIALERYRMNTGRMEKLYNVSKFKSRDRVFID